MGDRCELPHVDGVADRVVRAAMSSLPHVSLLLVDTAMRYLTVTGTMPAAHGYDPDRMVGRHVADALSPVAFARIGPKYERALRGETFTDVGGSVDDTAIFETVYGPAVEDGVVIGALAVVRDITVEHRAVAELAAAEHQHRVLIDNISDVVSTTTPDGRFLWVSPSAASVLGWRTDELLGRPVFEFIHPDDVDQIRARRTVLLAGGDPELVTYRFRRPDHGWTWLEGHVRGLHEKDPDTVTRLLVTARDISDRKRLTSDLAEATEMFELSFTAAPIGMALVGLDGRFLKVNDALCDLLGRDGPDLLECTFQDVTHPDDLVADVGLLQETVRGARTGYRMEKRYLRPDGSSVWTLLAVTAVRDGDGRPRFFISQVEDITERKDALHEMERLATTDHLTQLPNRLLLMDRLRHALALARRGGWLVGVIFLDLDRFKEVNDTLGHEAGDELLRQTADRLTRAAQESDTTTRLGGDEFVMVCEQVGSVDDVTRIAERLNDELSRPFMIFGHDVQLSASIGVTAGNTASAEALLREADRSMYTAKHGRPHRIDVYSEALEVVARDQLALHSALRAGIVRGELTVVYQPIVDLGSGAVVAREGLVRWQHPTLGLLQPSAFLGGTDRSRLGIAIGEDVLMRCCTAATSWPDDVAVHVNISARHLADPGFPGFVTRCLRSTGLAPDRLVLEITESLVLAASPSSLTSADALTTLGVGLSLDDFGTGYSSLTALHRLPIDSFKIDRSFIADAPGNPAGAALVEGLISLGSHMDLGVIAEGVETPEQADWLTSRGCPHAQGFHFGRPA